MTHKIAEHEKNGAYLILKIKNKSSNMEDLGA
jgi:hypothetical protein